MTTYRFLGKIDTGTNQKARIIFSVDRVSHTSSLEAFVHVFMHLRNEISLQRLSLDLCDRLLTLASRF
jgi:hypothetical protein